MAPEIIWSSWLFRLTRFANISGKYVLFDVAVFDLQSTLLVRQIEVLTARSIYTFAGSIMWKRPQIPVLL